MTNKEILGKSFKWAGTHHPPLEKNVIFKFLSYSSTTRWTIQNTLTEEIIINISGPNEYSNYWQLVEKKLVEEKSTEELIENKFLQWSHLYSNFDRLFYFCEKLDETDSSKKHDDKKLEECGFEEANLISSLCANGKHKPVLDLDFDCELVPSSTPGCFHLYINKEVDGDRYEDLLIAMKNAGLLQAGFVDSSIKRGASFVRPPWVKKLQKGF